MSDPIDYLIAGEHARQELWARLKEHTCDEDRDVARALAIIEYQEKEIARLQAMETKAGALDLCLTHVRKENKMLREVLQWLDVQGGLGYEKHDRIRGALGDEFKDPDLARVPQGRPVENSPFELGNVWDDND